MKTVHYDKLVRDAIPQIIKAQGKKAVTRILNDDEYREYLEKKLDEEVAEFHESKDVEELADILEVIIALAQSKGFSFFDLINMQTDKAVKRGGFSKKILLVEVCENEEGSGENGNGN